MANGKIGGGKEGVFEMDCPGCGQHLLIPSQYFGTEGSCKKCGMAFTARPEGGFTPKQPNFCDRLESAGESVQQVGCALMTVGILIVLVLFMLGGIGTCV